jgi:asparagine synthase (glutamine-hydrolysing)
VVRESFATLGEAFDVRVLHPLLEPLVLAGLSNTGGRRGWPDRTSALRQLVGDLLPEAVVARRSKAAFTEALVGERMRTFARQWSGDGVALVDPEALRHEWLSPSPVFQSMTALHAAWIHDQGLSHDPTVLPSHRGPGLRK